MPGPGFLTGQDLIDGANSRLAGYQNAIDSDGLLSFLNEAKDEVWAALKNLHTENFEQSTQKTDSTQLNFFPLDQNGNILPGNSLQTNLRQYTLPADFREIKFIEVTLQGYEQTVFTYRPIDSEDFRTARRSANVDPTLSPTVEYFYTISGKNQLVLAQFPEVNFTATLWYIRDLIDFTATDTIDQILFPYSKKMETYAVKMAMLSLQDPGQITAWQQQWRESLHTIETSASPRNQADAEYVEDFLG